MLLKKYYLGEDKMEVNPDIHGGGTTSHISDSESLDIVFTNYQSALEEEGGDIYVAQDLNDKGAKHYACLSKPQVIGMIQNDQNMYEILKEDKPHKMYIDFDCKYSSIREWAQKHPDDVIKDEIASVIQGWIEDFADEYNFGSSDWKIHVLDASNKVKFSFHFCADIVLRNHTESKIFHNKFLELIKNRYADDPDFHGLHKYIDHSVYTRNRLIRLPNQSKFGQDRPLRVFKGSRDIRDHLLTHINEEIPTAKIPKSWLKIKEKKAIPPPVSLGQEDEEHENLYALLDNLNEERWSVRDSWLRLVYIMMGQKCPREKIHEYSQICLEKYDEDYLDNNVIRSYDDQRTDSVGLGTLVKYLREDMSPDEYTKLVGDNPMLQTRLQTILNKRKEDRTQEDEEYVNMVFSSLNSYNIKKLTSTSLIKPQEKTDTFVDPEILNDGKKVCIVKAGLGRGKSTSVCNHINNVKYDNIIVLTPRRSYARSCCDRLRDTTSYDFVCYLNKSKRLLQDPFLVIQAESLYRVMIQEGKTLIIIDEIEAFLYQLTSTKTHGDKHAKNVETFMALVKNAKKIIALDAFISDRTLKTFNLLGIGRNDISFYDYTKKLEERKATEAASEKDFLERLISDLSSGKKIFLFCSSNKRLTVTTNKELKDGTVKVTTGILPAIREKFPDKNIIEFHSKFVSINLTNVNQSWKKADVIACTSTITVGCNFDLPNVFHKVYIFGNASSKNLVRDIFQASYRVRHLIDNEMVYWIDGRHYGSNFTTSFKQCETQIANKNDSVLNLFQKYQMEYPRETPSFITYLASYNMWEFNISVMNMEELYNRYLELCNYKKNEDEDVNIMEIEFDEFIEPTLEYKDIPDLTPSEFKALMKAKAKAPLLELQNARVEKYLFQNYLIERPQEIEEGLWKIYRNFGRGKFRNMSFEKGIQDGTVTLQDIIETSGYSHLSNGTCLRLEIINNINQWVGLHNSQAYGSTVTKDKLEEVIKLFEENRKKIHIAFDIRDRTKGKLNNKTCLALINKVLEKWGYSKISRGKQTHKRVDGKRLDMSSFQVVGTKNDNIDIYKFIKPRQKSKELKPLHPLLTRAEDQAFMTEEKLEELRLNPII